MTTRGKRAATGRPVLAARVRIAREERIGVDGENAYLQPLAERLEFRNGANPFHGRILGRLVARRDRGAEAVEGREAVMDRIDDALRMRIDLASPAIQGDGSVDYDELEMPETRVLVMPMMAATLDVIETQHMAVFMARSPTVQVEGRTGEDVTGAKLLELMQSRDESMMRMDLQLATAITSSLRYGFGPMRDCWVRNLGWREMPPQRRFGDGSSSLVEQQLERALAPELYEPSIGWGLQSEYGAICGVNPRGYRQDPGVYLGETQQAEYVGHCDTVGAMYLREHAEDCGGPLFNVDAAIEYGGRAARGRTGKTHAPVDDVDAGPFEVEHLEVKLVPREWGLSGEQRPQRWVFEWVDDAVIVRAHPLPNLHQESQYSVWQGTWHPFDELGAPGLAEKIEPLQRFSSFHLNAHVAMTRRNLGGSLIYAPELINRTDIEYPSWAGHLRLTEDGTNALLSGRLRLGDLVHQLAIADVTGPHLKLVSFFMDLAMRLSGASDPMSGIQLDTARTASEIQAIMTQASARVTRSAQTMDSTGLREHARRLIANRQQFTSLAEWYRAGGDDLANELERRVKGDDPRLARSAIGSIHALVSRADIQGRYDYVPHTGLMPSDPIRSAQTFLQLIQILSQVPPDQLVRSDGRAPDVAELANETLRKLGVKNIDQFYKLHQAMQPPQGGPDVNVGVVDDEEYRRGVESGRFVTPGELSGLDARALIGGGG